MPSMMSHFSPFPVDTRAIRVQGLGVQEVMQPCFLDRPRGWPNFLFVLFHDATPCRTRQAALRVSPGTLICWRPGTPHGLGDAERAWNHSWLSVAGTDVSRSIREVGFPLDRPVALHDLSFFDPALANIYGELVRPGGGKNGTDITIARNDIVSLIRRLGRAIRATPESAAIPESLLAVRRHIHAHFDDALVLRDLADHASLSVSQLCFLHKRHFGVTVMAYLRSVRLQRAALLLLDSGLKVRIVAEMVGYADQFHFSKAFHHQFGRPPGRFKREHRTGV